MALLHKKILIAEDAVYPIYGNIEETMNHLVFKCVFTRRFWRAIGFYFLSVEVKQILYYPAPRTIPAESVSTFMPLCCWQLWKHRNTVAIQAQRPCLPLLV
jgi:hypothetical protein